MRYLCPIQKLHCRPVQGTYMRPVHRSGNEIILRSKKITLITVHNFLHNGTQHTNVICFKPFLTTLNRSAVAVFGLELENER